ncbi:MAG: AP2 domain-containing protein [Clostridia bacterium]|nr:AP2 domain-containing protein [Clostridia bacterium]
MYNSICEYCGIEFKAKYKNRNYCSRKCACAAMSKKNFKEYKELIGKRFGRLVVVERERTDKRHPHLICNCDCGKQVSANVEQLLSGRTKSCGCLRIERTFVERTSLNTINSKIRVDNTSGIKGVSWYKPTNKWVAHIAFQKKKHTLGYYNNIQDAIKARKKAEEVFFKPVLDKYEITHKK